MAIDFKSAIDAKAWSLLEADSAFNLAFPAGCRMKDDPKARVQKATLRAPADFKQISIEVQDYQEIASQTPRTFGMNSISYTPTTVDVVKPSTLKLVVTMVFDKAASKASRFAAESAVRRVFKAAWPKFGLSYVADFSVTENTRSMKYPQGQQGSPERTVVTQTITFNLRPMLSQLV